MWRKVRYTAKRRKKSLSADKLAEIEAACTAARENVPPPLPPAPTEPEEPLESPAPAPPSDAPPFKPPVGWLSCDPSKQPAPAKPVVKSSGLAAAALERRKA